MEFIESPLLGLRDHLAGNVQVPLHFLIFFCELWKLFDFIVDAQKFTFNFIALFFEIHFADQHIFAIKPNLIIEIDFGIFIDEFVAISIEFPDIFH